MDEKSLKDKVDTLWSEKANEESTKKPKFKLKMRDWFRSRLGKRKIRKNYIIVGYIRENKNFEFHKAEVQDGCYDIDGTKHTITAEEVLIWNKRPIVIQPSWSITPFSPKEDHDETLEKNRSTLGYRILLNNLEKSVIDGKKKANMGGLILILLVLGGIGYYFFSGGSLF